MIENELTSWVLYKVQILNDECWGGYANHSTHDTLDEALLELGELKREGKNCRVIRVATDVVA